MISATGRMGILLYMMLVQVWGGGKHVFWCMMPAK